MSNRRRDRFIAWFNGPPMRGSRELLLKRTGYTKGRVSQLFDSQQPFGEKAAANLAERLGLPSDSFERDQSFAPGPPKSLLQEVSYGARRVATDQDLALLDDLYQLLPEEQVRWREELHARAEYARRIRDWRPGEAPPVAPAPRSNVADFDADRPSIAKTGRVMTQAQKERAGHVRPNTRRKGNE